MKKNTYSKRKSEERSRMQESFIIGAAISFGIELVIETKRKRPGASERFTITDIGDKTLSYQCEMEWKHWYNTYYTSNQTKRIASQTKQNIIFNCLIDEMKKKGHHIEYKLVRKNEKNIPRYRLIEFNGYNEQDIYAFGSFINNYLSQEIQIESGKKSGFCGFGIDVD